MNDHVQFLGHCYVGPDENCGSFDDLIKIDWLWTQNMHVDVVIRFCM